VFIIMELLTGESLQDLLSRLRVLPVPLAVDILWQVCCALDHAHRHGIIHRDVTTDNIFVLSGNRIKVMDFGLACPVGTEDINLSGTAAYISPEQIEGDPVDARTDVYGLGVVAYEMVTGRKPFAGPNTKAVLDGHLHKDIPDPGRVVGNLPEVLRTFIMKAARRDPDRRYQNIDEVMQSLAPLTGRPAAPERRTPPEERRLTNLILLYGTAQQQALGQLLEEFSGKAGALGVQVKISDPHTL